MDCAIYLFSITVHFAVFVVPEAVWKLLCTEHLWKEDEEVSVSNDESRSSSSGGGKVSSPETKEEDRKNSMNFPKPREVRH